MPLEKILVGIIFVCCGLYAAGSTEGIDIEQIAERDLYAVLELEPGADLMGVKAAYRELARKWHPDKNPSHTQLAQDKFAEIAEAYEILSNRSSRELYDRARGLRAAKQRRAAERMHKGSSLKGEGAGGFGGEESEAAQWYHPYADGMGEADDFFGYGTSFAETAGGAAAFAAFGSGPFFAGGGGVYEFHPQDPIDLFDAFFSGGFDDDDDDWYSIDETELFGRSYVHHGQERKSRQGFEQSNEYTRDQAWRRSPEQPRAQKLFEGAGYEHHQRPHERRWQEDFPEASWAGWSDQDYEQYHDYIRGGRVHRRVITTSSHQDGRSFSTAQDFILDEHSIAWKPTTDVFVYHGARVGSWGRSPGEGGDDGRPIDNVLRMNEFLRAGDSITSVDRRFRATLERNCNLVLYHMRRAGSRYSWDGELVWDTASFDASGRCYATIQDNGMFVIVSGDDPSAPGNVLWSNNCPHILSFGQTSFHASILPSGNLIVAQGESPMDPTAMRCVWGAFGCPGDGGLLEWKLTWISLRSAMDKVYCSWIEDEWCESQPDFGRGDSPIEEWRWQMLRRAARAVKRGMKGLDRLTYRGLERLRDVWDKVKTAAEEAAHAASRPRHW